MLTDLLFDTPWWLPTLLFGAGGVILLTGLRRGEKTPTRVGLGLLALGILITAVSHFVETDMEKAVNRTYSLARSVNERDWETFRSLLDPQTSMYGLGNRDALVELAKEKTESLGIQNVRITGYEAERGPIILVSIRVLAEFKSFGSVPSDWQLQWQDFGKGGILYNIRALSNQTTNEENIRRELERK